MYSVEMLPAALGDSLWVEYGDPAKPCRFLIDGGLVGTTDKIIRKIHDTARREGGLCRLELLVLSHVDADHIEGLIKLLGTKDLPLEIDDIWFNGYHHLPDPDAHSDDEFLGAKQGEFLAALIRERALPWNDMFGGGSVVVPTKGALPSKTLPGGMTLTLLSPTLKELRRMARKWDDELEAANLLHATHEQLMEALETTRKLAPDDEFLSAEELSVEELVASRQRKDTSPANGSSIAFLGSFDGRSCLFSGDAYWTVLRDSIKRLAAEHSQPRLPVDVFKVPHHGSRNNLSDELLSTLQCRRFLVSTNGSRFKHPDDEAIARMVGGNWRPTPQSDDPVCVSFNYRSPFNERWDTPQLQSHWNYHAVYPRDGTEGLLVHV